MNIETLDLASLRLPTNYTQLTGVKKVLLTVPLRKPRSQEFVRTHPVWRFSALVLKTQGDKRDDLFVVTPEIAASISDDIAPMQFVATVTRQETFLLWPIRLPGRDGRQDDWSRSALEASEIATTEWVRVQAKRDLNAYEVQQPVATFPEPVWPALEWDGILQIAFRNHVINAEDHPVLRALRGEL